MYSLLTRWFANTSNSVAGVKYIKKTPKEQEAVEMAPAKKGSAAPTRVSSRQAAIDIKPEANTKAKVTKPAATDDTDGDNTAAPAKPAKPAAKGRGRPKAADTAATKTKAAAAAAAAAATNGTWSPSRRCRIASACLAFQPCY